MAKVILEFNQNRPFQHGDLLVYNERAKSFELTTKERYLRAHTNEIQAIKQSCEQNIEEIKKSLETFKNGINDKLKNYHEILQNLTKGE